MGIFFSIIFFVFEALLLVLLLTKIKRYKSLTIKDTVVYPLLLILTFCLMIVARALYMDLKILQRLKDSFSDALNIIKLSFNDEMISLLKTNNKPLLFNYYGTFLISFVALSSLTVYLLRITVKNILRRLGVLLRCKDVILIFGFNEDAKKMIRFFKDEKIKMLAVLNSGILNKYVEEKTFLDKYKIGFIEHPYSEKKDFIKTIKATTKNPLKNYYIVTFFPDDKTNEEFSTEAIKYLKTKIERKQRRNVRIIMNVNTIQDRFIQNKIYVKFVPPDKPNRDITEGCLRTYNKYDLNSFIFNQNHTFAKYVHSKETADEVFIHPDCTLSGCDIHAYFIGFGQVNQSLLRDVLIQNQFVQKTKDENGLFALTPKRINVDIYDERKRLNAFDLSNGLFKYNKSSFDQNNYLELPEDYVSHINFNFDTNIEDLHFIDKIYNEIKDRIKKDNVKQFNFFFVSLQSDMYNSLITKEIKKSLDPIDGSYNFFFVRKESLAEGDNDGNNVFCVCNDKDVFSHKNILLNELYESAKYQHYLYDGKKYNVQEMDKEWNDLLYIKQKSNLYAVNGLVFKSDLLNPDPKDYGQKYNPHNLAPAGENDIDRLSKSSDHFDAIDVLAFLEHERWNAFELANGVLPMKKSMFYELNKDKFKKQNEPNNRAKDQTENKKDLIEVKNQTEDCNYHLSITTAKGLVDYYNLFKENGFNKANVIAYDYTAMDNYVKDHTPKKTDESNHE